MSGGFKIKDVVLGHANELLKKNTKLKNERMRICHKCPLFTESNIGPMCDPNKYLNPVTGEFRYSSKEGYIKGCGCRLSAKATLEDAHCPADKW